MLQKDQNRNIVNYFFKRERGSQPCLIRSDPKVIRRLIESDETKYEKCWNKRSKKDIFYQSGYLFFDNASSVFSLYGPKGCPTKAFNVQQNRARGRIMDMAIYSQPIVQENCVCLRRCILLITKDQWLIQCDFETGAIWREVNVKSHNHAYKFHYCLWNTYGSQFSLTSNLNPNGKSNALGYMALFNVSPLELKWCFEITREVFGKSIRNYNLSEQIFLVAVQNHQVDIYSFDDVIKEGVFLSDEVQSFDPLTSGLAINFRIQRAPPVLLKVQSYGQIIQFGGYPHHYLFPNPKQKYSFSLRNLMNDDSQTDNECTIETSCWWNESHGVSFHPDSSNRVLVQNLKSLNCFKFVRGDNNSVDLIEVFEVKFLDLPLSRPTSEFSHFGRRLKQRYPYFTSERSIFAIDYEDEMDMIAVLGVHSNDPSLRGFIRLFDSLSGQELKTIDLEEGLEEHGDHLLSIDLDVIVLIAKDDIGHKAYVYKMYSAHDTS